MFPLRPAKTYTYPDGTQSVNRPSDGQVFIVWDGNQKPQSTWQWDDYLEQWFNVSSGKPTPQNTASFIVPTSTQPPLSDEEMEELSALLDEGRQACAVACECGARHTEFPNIHLRFCPLYTP